MDSDACRTLTSHNDLQTPPERRSIAERRAAKCGFNAERINTARFRTLTSPLASPLGTTTSRSPFLTIPPGISPAALLDSPMLLPNSQISPTTGTFPLAFFDFESSVIVDSSLKKESVETSDSLIGYSSIENLGPVSMDFEFHTDLCKKDDAKSCVEELATDVKVSDADANINDVPIPDVASNQPSLLTDQVNRDNKVPRQTVEEHNGIYNTTGNGRTSEDGYNWRKYGQKQVKGSEYPRSYYKCTHPSCPVKKKIERSHDGQITEIIYKGAHNHPTPQPNRRGLLGSCSSLDEMQETDGISSINIKGQGGSAWKDMEGGRADGLERTSSASVVTDLSDPLSHTQTKSVRTFESAEPELSSTLASRDDDDEDQVTRRSVSPGAEANDEESDPKRRKIESSYLESNLVSRAVREPRVVVQIESEVDILDDGYRWRKYGQKVVKGNPNPRSYYKCTSAGCTVRKHVERASHNLKYVITTYEGKHNHEVPAARNSTNINTSVNLNHTTANQHPPLALARNSTVPKSEMQLQDFIPGFDRKPVFHSDYYGTNFAGNFAGDVKLGTSSIYGMKFPSMVNTMAYGSFGFSSNCGVGNLAGCISSLAPEFQFSLPSSASGGADFSNGEVEGLIRPKQEEEDDGSYDHLNASSSTASSLYHQIRGNFPA